jgi:hypothetical protein
MCIHDPARTRRPSALSTSRAASEEERDRDSRDGDLMDDHSRRSLSDDAVGARLILGLDPAMMTFRCADCGVVGEPGEAPLVKAFLIDQLLGCEPRLYDLFLDRSVAPRALSWLRHLSYSQNRAADLIGAALELSLLDGRPDALRMGAARCADCYLARGAAFKSRRHQETDL